MLKGCASATTGFCKDLDHKDDALKRWVCWGWRCLSNGSLRAVDECFVSGLKLNRENIIQTTISQAKDLILVNFVLKTFQTSNFKAKGT